MPEKESNLLRWKIDIDTYRKLGRELITDRLTALYELIKNCYDANAREVYLDFFNVSSPDGKITIKDDGIGMSLWDFRNKWMVISTAAKRLEKTSPPPFYRVLLGEKGIGRFAVDKLASKVIIRTKREGMSERLLFEIDWSKYDNIKNNGVIDREKLKSPSPGVEELEKAGIIYPSEHKEFFYWSEDIESEEELITRIDKTEGEKDPDYLAALWKETHKIYLTDIEHKVSLEPGKLEEQGTELILSPLRETWDKDDIERVYWELSKVLPPDSNLEYGFKIILNSNEHFEIYKNKVVVNRAIDFATEFFELEGTEDCQERIEFDDKKGKLKKTKGNVEKFGPIKFKLYYFDQYGKANFRKHYQYYRINGIKIYRDGVITNPFAEFTEDINKQRDILGIDKRRWSGFFEKVSSRDLIGIVQITKEKNPKIIDATNRQDFIDCAEYRSLKDFIVAQIFQLEKLLKYKKEKDRKITDKHLKEARKDLKAVKTSLNKLAEKVPGEYKSDLMAFKKIVLTLDRKFKEGVRKQDELEKEIKSKEYLYQSIISLDGFSKMVAHALSISLGKIKGMAEYMKDKMSDFYIEKQEIFIKYSRKIYAEMSKTAQVLDFMLDYTRVHSKPKLLYLSLLIKEVLEVNEFNFKQECIEVEKFLDPTITIFANESAFRIIIENLISNSRKALRNIDGNRKIKISLFKDGGEKIVLLFSDNGIGIPPENRDKIYEVYFTTTADQGGAGLGLYVVKNFLKSYKGEISLVANEFKAHGASFKITLPIKKENQNE